MSMARRSHTASLSLAGGLLATQTGCFSVRGTLRKIESASELAAFLIKGERREVSVYWV